MQLIRLRERAGLSQLELARRAEVSRTYIQRLEAGEYQKPSLAYLQKLAAGLDVPLEELIGGGSGEQEDRELAVARRFLRLVRRAALPEEHVEHFIREWVELPTEGQEVVVEFVRVLGLWSGKPHIKVRMPKVAEDQEPYEIVKEG